MVKYQKKNEQQRTANFLRFELDTPKTLTVTDWDFSKNPAGYLFRCYVEKEDGESVDKIWTVWDYGSAQRLKKKLGAKPSVGGKEIKIVMKLDEEENENYFEIL